MNPPLQSVLPLEEANRLAADNVRLAYSVAIRSAWTGIDADELQSICLEELLKASRRFDPRRGTKFSTLAVTFMKGGIRRHFALSQCDCRLVNTLAATLSAEHSAGHIIDRKTARPDETAERGDDIAQLKRRIRQLPANHRIVIRRRFFQYKTLEEIGAELGLTKERIRQIQIAALDSLREETIGPRRLPQCRRRAPQSRRQRSTLK